MKKMWCGRATSVLVLLVSGLASPDFSLSPSPSVQFLPFHLSHPSHDGHNIGLAHAIKQFGLVFLSDHVCTHPPFKLGREADTASQVCAGGSRGLRGVVATHIPGPRTPLFVHKQQLSTVLGLHPSAGVRSMTKHARRFFVGFWCSSARPACHRVTARFPAHDGPVEGRGACGKTYTAQG
ncbi:uncharacterized protein B0T15DRAFT_128703 [Chaetomium strumarium]|uniref:Secreted protein n=1 Tax=Chaetomium strumarium TaxID=1170767 RepID=A0AAJ0GZJ0_9PEZI|nr:hypothetical protein B0T15DRAFT_128703 [Chaetomium strumarium]